MISEEKEPETFLSGQTSPKKRIDSKNENYLDDDDLDEDYNSSPIKKN